MRILRINDPVDGGAAGVFDEVVATADNGSPASGDAGTGDADAAGGDADADADAPAAPVVTPPQLTADAIAEAMKRIGVGQPQAPATPEKQYTQSDFDKAFQVFDPSPELVAKLLEGGPAAIQAMGVLRDGLVRQAVTMASYIVQDQIEKYDAKQRPENETVRNYVAQKRVKELYNDFYSANKDLKPYDSVVQAAVQQLKAEGAQFKDKMEGFKAAAERTRAILKTIPGISLEAGAAGGQSPNPTRMPTLSKGGQGGLGKGSGGVDKSKDPSHSIFG